MCRKSKQRKAVDVNKKGIALEIRTDVDSDPSSATQELGDLRQMASCLWASDPGG